METGGSDAVFGVDRMELSMIVVGAVLAAAFSWVANDATGTLRIASTAVTGVVALVVATFFVGQLSR